MAISRFFSQGMMELSKPAIPSLIGHGPSLARRVQRPPAKQKRVAGHCLYTGLFPPSLEILGIDPGSGFQIRYTLESRNVVQDASRDDAVFHRQDGTLSSAALHGDQTCYRIAIPHLSIKEDVCE